MTTQGNTAAVKHLKKTFGSAYDGTINLGSVLKKRGQARVWYDTGSLTLNKAINLRGRGIPGGAFTVLAGESQGGKSLLGVLTLVDCQRKGGLAILIDVEGAFDFEFGKKLGIDLEALIYIGPTRHRKINGVVDTISPLTVTDVCELVEEMLAFVESNYPAGHPCVILWDSISATNTLRNLGLEKTGEDTYKVLDGGAPKREQGGPAGWLKAWLRRLDARLSSTNVALLGVSHVYANIGGYSSKPIVSGGSGVAYFATTRLLFTKREGKKWKIFKDGDEEKGIVIGEQLDVYVEKNRVGPPYTRVYLDFYFGVNGEVRMDPYGGLLDFFISHEVVNHDKGSTWYNYGGDNFRKKQFPEFLEAHPEMKEM